MTERLEPPAGEPEKATPPELPTEEESKIERLVDHGFSYEVAAKMVGVDLTQETDTDTPAATGNPAEPHKRQGYVKDGSRRRIKTPADARAADRLPDEDWRFR